MKIVILQSAGQHEANKQFREALCLQRELIHLGHDTRVCGRGYHAGYPGAHDIDALVLVENYDIDWIPDFSRLTCPKLFWSIDGFICQDMHQKMVDKYKIDVVLSSTKAVKFNNAQILWFPNAYPADLFYNGGIMPEESIDLGFCGTPGNPERQSYIGRLKCEYGLRHDNMILGDGMVKAIGSYKIHFNRNLANDINARTFETLGCGTFLLTNYTDGLEDLFTIGEHLVTYANYDDCVDKIKYYLGHGTERSRIARAGFEHARMRHTYLNRAEELVNIINARRGS